MSNDDSGKVVKSESQSVAAPRNSRCKICDKSLVNGKCPKGHKQ